MSYEDLDKNNGIGIPVDEVDVSTREEDLEILWRLRPDLSDARVWRMTPAERRATANAAIGIDEAVASR